MNILILGGAGFLGCNLVRRCLKDEGNTIRVVDALDPRLKSTTDNLAEVMGRIDFIQGSLCDRALMDKVVADADVIFNCAAQTSHPLSLSDPFFDVEMNCVGNLHLLESVKEKNRTAKVIYTSSSTIIGKALNEVVDETHGEAPLDIYSANKGVAEKYYRIYHTLYDMKTLSLRFANLYGPYGKGYPEFGFINYFIELARRNQDITI
ncbi:MAG: NAD-dependent epimerase/dehydratase family protein, partial [Candidatus Omnitrophica bacterium]|nr:NAD-dependent epimerase/dehydratase family protein [Candidatus Omnitrophota bacterium]